MKNKILFIGSINPNIQPSGGEEAKNQILLQYFLENKIHHSTIDFSKNQFFQLIKLIILLFFYKKIILSKANDGAYLILKIIYLFNILLKKEVIYLVIGGTLNKSINKKYHIKYYRIIERIFVESQKMKNDLITIGLNNVDYLPNFKKIYPVVLPSLISEITRFIFLSRITPEKGVDLIIDANKYLIEWGYSDKYLITFYGKIENEYKKTFLKSIKESNFITFEGFLNIDNIKSYQLLTTFDCMLFPTRHFGEGMPGIFIDASIAGLAIIASEWNYNSEYVKNGFNGLLMSEYSGKVLAEKMKLLIENKQLLEKLRINSFNQKDKYDYTQLLNKVL